MRRADWFAALRVLQHHDLIERSGPGFLALGSRVPDGLGEPGEPVVSRVSGLVSKTSAQVPEGREPGRAKQMLDRAFALLSQDVVSEADRLLSDSCRELAKELRLAAGKP
jgi:hypothetical protein